MMKKKVLVSYHYFAHYRLPIIKELSNDSEIDYVFCSGSSTNYNIRVISRSDMMNNKIKWEEIKNIWLIRKRLLWQKGLISECVFGKYDSIVFLGNPYALSTWVAALITRLTGKRIFFWAHGIVRAKKRDKIKLAFLKLADGIFLYGNWAKKRLIEHGLDQRKLHVVYNSLDYSLQVEIRKSLSLETLSNKKKTLFKNNELPVLLFIGRLTYRKKLDKLILSCEQLRSRGMPVNLLIVGDGEDKNNLISISHEKQLDDYVCFYGESYDENELAPLIALSDVCVSPGDVGLTAIHSLSYGTPVITHDNPFEQMPEFEAISPGKTGAFFEYENYDSLVTTISEWIKENHTNREEVRKNCYEIIDKYYNPAYQAKVIKSIILKNYQAG